MNTSIEHIAISWCNNESLIDIKILGCKNKKQAMSNLNNFSNSIKL